tara:strand:+ start:26812 stop:27387 length:576 start_codon:yes stop_codon:yes gene_type:complete
MTTSAVFLDRDGVLSETDVRDGKPFAPTRFEDFRLIQETRPALIRLKQKGYLLVVVTNQPDVGNGLVARATIERMNAALARAVPVDAIKTCFHSQQEGCDCRKPEPGMILEAAAEMHIDLETSYLVGDRRGDIVAGARAGCTTIFINRGYREPSPDRPDFTVTSLTEAVDTILFNGRHADRLEKDQSDDNN